MNHRLRRAITEASELRAMLVLLVVLMLHAWRSLQVKYMPLPSIIDLIEHIRNRFLVWFIHYLYQGHVHWIGSR